MNKTELMETYTAEHLAEMVIKLRNASEVKNDEIHKLKWQISNLEEESGRLQTKIDTYNNYLLPKATKEAYDDIARNHYTGIRIVTCEQWNNRIEKELNEPDIQRYEDTIDKLQSEVNHYRKSFEDAKNERDCQIAEYQKKIEELTAERDFLSKDSISVHQDPIDIAKDLINAEGEYEHNPVVKAISGNDKGTYRIFDVSELRQIAEHLLVYCNHNGEVEE